VTNARLADAETASVLDSSIQAIERADIEGVRAVGKASEVDLVDDLAEPGGWPLPARGLRHGEIQEHRLGTHASIA
jgi:hypothetical protein